MSDKTKCRRTFPKSLRLLDKAEYDAVFSNALKVGDQYFLLLARANPQGHARLGLAISKKQARLAVQRNRLKRLVRESFRVRQEALPSADIVVLARRGAADTPSPELAVALDRLWRKLSRRLAGSGDQR